MFKISFKILLICFGYFSTFLGCHEGITADKKKKVVEQKLSSSAINNSYFLFSRKGKVNQKWREGFKSHDKLNEFNSYYDPKDKVVQIDIKNAVENDKPKEIFTITKKPIVLAFMPPKGTYVLEKLKNSPYFILQPCKIIGSKIIQGTSLPMIEKIEPITDWNPLENKFTFNFDSASKMLTLHFEEKEEKDIIDFTGRYFGWATYIFQAADR